MTPGTSAGQRAYKAFLSHSHEDQELAKRLHRRLEAYRPPRSLARAVAAGTVPRRLAPVFRDEDELPAESDLGAVIQRALAASEFLIVLCSPAAARSRWVDQEVLEFKRLGGAGRVISVLVAGEPGATEHGDPANECFPPTLRFALDEEGRLTDRPVEPSAADLRPGKGGFPLAFAKVCARMLGVPLDELLQRERARRRKRWTLGLVTAALVLTALGLGIRQVRERQRRDALELAQLEAANVLRAGDRAEALAGLGPVARSGVPGVVGEDRLGVLLRGLVPLDEILGRLSPTDVFEWHGATYGLDARGHPVPVGRFDTEHVFVSEEHELAVLIRPDTSLETFRLPDWKRLDGSTANPPQVPEAFWHREDLDELLIAGRFSSGSSIRSIRFVHWTVDLQGGTIQESGVYHDEDPEFWFTGDEDEAPTEEIAAAVHTFQSSATSVTPRAPSAISFPVFAPEASLWSKDGASGSYMDVHGEFFPLVDMDPEIAPEYALPYKRVGLDCGFVVANTIYGGMGGTGFTACDTSSEGEHACQEFGHSWGSGDFRGAVVTPGCDLAIHGHGLESDDLGTVSNLCVLSGDEPLYSPAGLETDAEILDLSFSPSGTRMALFTADGVVLYEVQDPSLRSVVRQHGVPNSANLFDLAFLDEDLLVVLRSDATLEALPLDGADAPPWPALLAIPSEGPDQEAVDPVLAVDPHHDWVGLVDRAGGTLTVFDGRLGARVIERFALPYERLPFEAVPALEADADGTLRLRWGEVTWTRTPGRANGPLALFTGFLPEAPDRAVTTLDELFAERIAD